MLTEGLIRPEELPEMLEAISSGIEPSNGEANAYTIVSNEKTFESENVSFLAMIAPGMALMFLMYNVTAGGVSFLIERREYTLQRNLVSPTRSYQLSSASLWDLPAWFCPSSDPGTHFSPAFQTLLG